MAGAIARRRLRRWIASLGHVDALSISCPLKEEAPAFGWNEEMKAAAAQSSRCKNGLTMKKYMTDKDRAEEAETLKIALKIIEIAGLNLDSKIPILPPQFARYLIAPDAYLLIVPATTLDGGDRRRIENAMCMSKCDAVVVSVSRPTIGPKKVTLEIGIDGLVPIWHSEYCARVIDGTLYFAPTFDPSKPLFKLTDKGLTASSDFNGVCFGEQ